MFSGSWIACTYAIILLAASVQLYSLVSFLIVSIYLALASKLAICRIFEAVGTEYGQVSIKCEYNALFWFNR